MEENKGAAEVVERKLKGLQIDIIGDAWEAAKEQIKGKDNLIIVPDLESGYPQIMTIEDANKLKDLFESCRPKSIEVNTKVFLFGTGGEIKTKGWFNSWFYNEENE